MFNKETEIAYIWMRNDEKMNKVYEHIANTKGRADSSRPPLTIAERANILRDYINHLCMGKDSTINGKANDLVCDLVTHSLNMIDYIQLIKDAREEADNAEPELLTKWIFEI